MDLLKYKVNLKTQNNDFISVKNMFWKVIKQMQKPQLSFNK